MSSPVAVAVLSVAVPGLVAKAYVKLDDVAEATSNVPLYPVMPAMVTSWPTTKLLFAVIVTVPPLVLAQVAAVIGSVAEFAVSVSSSASDSESELAVRLNCPFGFELEKS